MIITRANVSLLPGEENTSARIRDGKVSEFPDAAEVAKSCINEGERANSSRRVLSYYIRDSQGTVTPDARARRGHVRKKPQNLYEDWLDWMLVVRDRITCSKDAKK